MQLWLAVLTAACLVPLHGPVAVPALWARHGQQRTSRAVEPPWAWAWLDGAGLLTEMALTEDDVGQRELQATWLVPAPWDRPRRMLAPAALTLSNRRMTGRRMAERDGMGSLTHCAAPVKLCSVYLYPFSGPFLSPPGVWQQSGLEVTQGMDLAIEPVTFWKVPGGHRNGQLLWLKSSSIPFSATTCGRTPIEGAYWPRGHSLPSTEVSCAQPQWRSGVAAAAPGTTSAQQGAIAAHRSSKRASHARHHPLQVSLLPLVKMDLPRDAVLLTKLMLSRPTGKTNQNSEDTHSPPPSPAAVLWETLQEVHT